MPVSKINLVERARFQDGSKLIAILSDAGATGVSLHADRAQVALWLRLKPLPHLD